jgi:hypothetical protein
MLLDREATYKQILERKIRAHHLATIERLRKFSGTQQLYEAKIQSTGATNNSLSFVILNILNTFGDLLD